MPDLIAIAYVSSAVRPMDSAAMEVLLADARDFNRAQGVTGVLLHRDGCFMQYFEGSPAGMARVYERIHASKQHTGLIELMNHPITARSFADWTMGFGEPNTTELMALSTARWMEMNQAARQKPGVVPPGLILLRHFWERE